MKKALKVFGYIILTLIILVVILYGAVYFAVAKGWTNEEGAVDTNNTQYEQSYVDTIGADKLQTVTVPADTRTTLSKINECELTLLKKFAPANAAMIANVKKLTISDELESRMIFTVGLKVPELKPGFDQCISTQSDSVGLSTNISPNPGNLYSWVNTEEWPIIVEAISKDKDKITQASASADLDSRMLLAPLAVEQLRLYFTQREYYEKFFKPLKILVTTNQMAWGVMAIKEKAAIQIENNLKDTASPYYLGAKYEHLLDFTTDDVQGERFKRLTNEKDHSWSYLYGALYIKQLETQRKKAGYPIEKRPEVVATLYNLGYEKSKPKKNPEVGGSTLSIAGSDYTFGGLAFEIYFSGEMKDAFAYPLVKSSK